MPGSDLFLQAIDAVYASGLDNTRVPQALEATSRLLGASGAILTRSLHRAVRGAQPAHSICPALARRSCHLGPSDFG